MGCRRVLKNANLAVQWLGRGAQFLFGNQDPTSHMVWPPQKRKKKNTNLPMVRTTRQNQS